MSAGERGGALPATLIVTALLLLIGMEAAMIAGAARLGASRSLDAERAYRLSEAALPSSTKGVSGCPFLLVRLSIMPLQYEHSSIEFSFLSAAGY